MRDPIRMLESDELSSLERELLESARSEEPGPAQSGILLAGLSLPFSSYPGAGVSPHSASGGRLSPGPAGLEGGASLPPAAAALGFSGAQLLRLGVKVTTWGASVGLAGALVFWGLSPSVDRGPSEGSEKVASNAPPTQLSQTRPSEKPQPIKPGALEPAAPELPLADPVTPLAARSPSSNPGRAEASGASLTAEIAALDPARLALRAGDGSQALALLNRYRAKFPSGTLRPEADALRAQAKTLVKSAQLAETEAKEPKATSNKSETPTHASATLKPR